MAHAMVTVHAVPALTDTGISSEEAAFLSIGLVTLLSIIGRLLFGWLGDRVDKRYLFMASYLLQGLGIVALMKVHDARSAYLFAALFGVGFGGTIPLAPAIRGQYFGRSAFGKIQGFMAPITMMGSVVGPVLAGVFFDLTGKYTIGFSITALLQLLAAGTIFFARPARPRPT
jgi:MFS family permease